MIIFRFLVFFVKLVRKTVTWFSFPLFEYIHIFINTRIYGMLFRSFISLAQHSEKAPRHICMLSCSSLPRFPSQFIAIPPHAREETPRHSRVTIARSFSLCILRRFSILRKTSGSAFASVPPPVCVIFYLFFFHSNPISIGTLINLIAMVNPI